MDNYCFFRNTPDKCPTTPTQVNQTTLGQCTCQCTCRTNPRTNLDPEGPVSVIGTPGDLVVIPGVPDPGITTRFGNPLQRILVVTTNEFDEEVLRVTYDDNGANNQWGFHEGGGSIHVTELFRTPGLGGLLVEIMGVTPPSFPEVKWRLTVSEDEGVPDRFPIFLPEEPEEVYMMHPLIETSLLRPRLCDVLTLLIIRAI
ncbi:hypothetical protein GBAR_LOCUS22348 [Geodia barretti]|uniref:Uncharacterized protein n=1 Tax=Geodia barretti TaxID=519541 RepID=A0AA35T4C3_GEOBA|nr:hypothetical protein GBAR_LOCUS22348 [Geodia barretti]